MSPEPPSRSAIDASPCLLPVRVGREGCAGLEYCLTPIFMALIGVIVAIALLLKSAEKSI